MQKIYCKKCGKEIKDGESALGITDGVISSEYMGFMADDSTEWEVYCSDCAEVVRMGIDILKDMMAAMRKSVLGLMAATSAANREGNDTAVEVYRKIGDEVRAAIDKATAIKHKEQK